MTLEHRHQNSTTGRKVVMTACSFCDEPLPDDTGFSHHWSSCPANPANADGGDGR